MPDVILALLAAAKANAAAAQATVDAAIALYTSGGGEVDPGPLAADPDAPCIHPVSARLPCATLANPHGWLCGDCGFNGGPENG